MLSTIDYWIKKAQHSVSPSKEERAIVDAAAEELLERCSSAIKKTGVRARVELGGSYAHDTWLPGDADIDAFIILPAETNKEEVPTIGLAIGNQALSGLHIVKRFAEHPYLESYIKGIRVNIVPCIDSRQGQWKTAADRSPYHTRYMLSSMDDEKRQQVRLLKKFMKVQNLYGAEIRVRGFSGYVCEVLISRYRTFLDLIYSASAWKSGTVITVRGTDIGKEEGISILDPVDEKRNLARAISNQKMAEFIHLCRIIQHKETEDPFSNRLLLPAKMTKQVLENIFVLTFNHKQDNEDILWGEINRTAKNIAKHLSLDGFQVLNYSSHADKESVAVAFLLANSEREKIVARLGPPLFYSKEHSKFLSSASLGWWFTDDLRTKRLEERNITSLQQILEEYMRDNKAGIAKGLFDLASSTWRIFSGDQAINSGKDLLVKALEEVVGYAQLDSD